MKKILITGANSYIGNSVEQWLLKSPNEYTVDIISMIDDSWRNISFSEYDTILHVAGIAHKVSGKVNKKLYYKVNRDLAIDAAVKAKKDGVKQFIFMSSMSLYEGHRGNITLNTPFNVKGHYGKSKLQADLAIQKLACEQFVVSIIRPPMIFGKDCKGNFPRLVKFSNKLPVFPNIKNKRSMLYIENFCEFVKLIIDNVSNGIFFPQNSYFFSTSEIVDIVSKFNNKKIRFTKLFNWIIYLLVYFSGKINKLFGNLTYDQAISNDFNGNYRLFENKESIEKSI